MNRKANISVNVFVLGVFLVFGLMAFSFYFSLNKSSGKISDVNYFVEMDYKIESYCLYKDLGVSDTDIKDFLEVKTDASGDYLESGSLIDKTRVVYYLKYIKCN